MEYLSLLIGGTAGGNNFPIEVVIAAGFIVASGLGGLAVGYLLGHRSGKLSGELETLKSMRRPKVHRSRGSTASREEDE